MPDLRRKRNAFIMANKGVEQVELTEPWKALRDKVTELKSYCPRAGLVREEDPSGTAELVRI